MEKWIGECSEVYKMMGDDISRKIYETRIMYSLTGADEYKYRLVNEFSVWKDLQCLLDGCRNKKPILLYGIGIRGRILVDFGEKWDAIIDNSSEYESNAEYKGIKIYNTEAAKKNYPDAVIVVANREGFEEIQKSLLEVGYEKEDIINFGKMWNDFRDSQYFSLEQLPHADDEVFVDCGAYDGMTSVQFSNWCQGRYEKIICYEPDTQNVRKCEENLKRNLTQNKYIIIPKGNWSGVDQLFFNEEGTVASKIDQRGTAVINVTSIDEDVKSGKISKITFIKMDIEGAEFDALKGVEKVIKEQSPKLGISVYHKRDDIFKIPALIRQFNPSYTFYLRHYYLDDTDTVLFAVPKMEKLCIR
ncbi:FkbM family methyltransferase [Enterocloster sp. OA13]|uniref:FkbM family methyltransferase n=1 Tax=Enterocloster sp. OA13 TaxID=2914161 RepID=UPI0004722758|nr:FkbM family methyltransferase [Enterocloster sp. OA13]